jgi:hypothetical protein
MQFCHNLLKQLPLSEPSPWQVQTSKRDSRLQILCLSLCQPLVKFLFGSRIAEVKDRVWLLKVMRGHERLPLSNVPQGLLRVDHSVPQFRLASTQKALLETHARVIIINLAEVGLQEVYWDPARHQ